MSTMDTPSRSIGCPSCGGSCRVVWRFDHWRVLQQYMVCYDCNATVAALPYRRKYDRPTAYADSSDRRLRRCSRNASSQSTHSARVLSPSRSYSTRHTRSSSRP